MSAVPEDIHLSSQLVAPLGTLQLRLPATSVGDQLRKCQRLGTIGAPHQTFQSLARSRHAAALGLSKTAEPLVWDASLAAVARLAENCSRSHHPRPEIGRQPRVICGWRGWLRSRRHQTPVKPGYKIARPGFFGFYDQVCLVRPHSCARRNQAKDHPLPVIGSLVRRGTF